MSLKPSRQIRAAITAVGHYLPEEVLTNDDIARMVDTSDEWITSRVGIRRRHILRDPDAGASLLGIAAVQDLLRRHPVDPASIDLVLCSTNTPDHLFPTTASIVMAGAGLPDGAPCFDFQAACSGFVYGLQIARSFIESGLYRRILLVTAEKLSCFADPTDRSTLPLFGDGGAAVLLEPTEEEPGVIDILLGSEAQGHREDLLLPAGGSARPASHETVDRREHYLRMNGQVIFRHAVRSMGDSSAELLRRNRLSAKEIDYVIPHQANLRIMRTVADELGLEEEKLLINVDHCGNTSSASIPIVLSEQEKRLRCGDLLLLTAFGAGLTYGSALLRWAYDTI